MERYTEDCARAMASSIDDTDELLGIGKQKITAEELQRSLRMSLERLRNGIEFILLMRRKVARLALELAKSTNNYDLQTGEAALKAELDKCNMHTPILPFDAILADINKKLKNQENY